MRRGCMRQLAVGSWRLAVAATANCKLPTANYSKRYPYPITVSIRSFPIFLRRFRMCASTVRVSMSSAICQTSDRMRSRETTAGRLRHVREADEVRQVEIEDQEVEPALLHGHEAGVSVVEVHDGIALPLEIEP